MTRFDKIKIIFFTDSQKYSKLILVSEFRYPKVTKII